MPTRGKPSDWRPLDADAVQELYEVDQLYEGGIAGLVALATPSSPKAAAELDSALRGIIVEFRIDLHYEDRPTTPNVRAALRASPTASDLNWLRGLDPDTRRAIADEAHWELPNPQREPHFVDGEMRLAAAERELERLDRWVSRAEARLKPGKPGRPLRQSVHNAVERLRDAWTTANGSDPTLSSPQSKRSTGALLAFVRAVLVPALRAHGIDDMDLERAVRDELYGS
jgi:hypothetical protein